MARKDKPSEAAAQALAEERRAPRVAPYQPRDHRRDFAPQVERSDLPPWAGWGGDSKIQPPPPAFGTDVHGRPWEPPEREIPQVITPEMIAAVIEGGGWYGYWPTMERVTLCEAEERIKDQKGQWITKRERCGGRWFDVPLFDPMDRARNDYEAARNEAVRILEARTVKARSKGLVTTESLDRRVLRCQGCSEVVPSLTWSEEHTCFLCRECGPELVFLAEPVKGR
jgi:hypothetical protein